MIDGSVLITGGSGGIGSAAALCFAANGYDVAVQYNANRERAEDTAEAIRRMGRRSVAVCADVSDSAQVTSMIEQVRVCVGEIGVLVNNAGIADSRMFTDVTPELWNKMISVNLTGAYNCCRAVVPLFLSRCGGCIVNVSSVWGLYGASCEVHYSAAKAGLIGLTSALAKELGPSGVRVNCVAPGFIDTEMNKEYDEEARNDVIERTALCRLGLPEDVAEAIVFLASDKARFITGVTLPVTGGFC